MPEAPKPDPELVEIVELPVQAASVTDESLPQLTEADRVEPLTVSVAIEGADVAPTDPRGPAKALWQTWIRRRPLQVAIALAVVVLLIIGTIVWRSDPIRTQTPIRVKMEDLVVEYDKDFSTAQTKYQGLVVDVELKAIPQWNFLVGKDSGGEYVATLGERIKTSDRPIARITTPGQYGNDLQMAAFGDPVEILPLVEVRLASSDVRGFAGTGPEKIVVVRCICRGARRDRKTEPDFFLTFDRGTVISPK